MTGWQVWLAGWCGLTAVLNGVTYLAYATDKAAAQRPQARRVPERTLHLLALAGGWPAAWLAQRRLRHKTVKPAFRAWFWATVAGHLLGVLLVLWLASAVF